MLNDPPAFRITVEPVFLVALSIARENDKYGYLVFASTALNPLLSRDGSESTETFVLITPEQSHAIAKISYLSDRAFKLTLIPNPIPYHLSDAPPIGYQLERIEPL